MVAMWRCSLAFALMLINDEPLDKYLQFSMKTDHRQAYTLCTAAVISYSV
jgi:hypothetical protein